MMQTQSMRIKMKTERYTLYMNDEYNIRLLDTEEIKSIYNEHIVTDFPASEVKPLKQMLEKRENGQYFVYGLFESNTDDDGAPQEELSGYAYFIKCRNMDVYLLDYLAIVKDKRSKHLGTHFLGQLKQLAKDDGKLLMLEVENPDYADDGAAKDYMLKRIGFYKKNGMNLSDTSCYFLENEYRIFYAGDIIEDKSELDNITDTVYRDFFGDTFVDANVVFH